MRKQLASLITDEEINTVENGIKKYSKLKRCIIDVNKEVITIYVSDRERNGLEIKDESLPFYLNHNEVKKYLKKNPHYTSSLQFILADKEDRLFVAHRFCSLGAFDGWISVDKPVPLNQLVKHHFEHLGQDSYFGLF